jgi:hypothetical protein
MEEVEVIGFPFEGVKACRRGVVAASSSFDETEDEADHGQHDEDEEQNLRNAGGAGSDATETKQRGDQSDDKKDDCVMQHGGLRWLRAAASIAAETKAYCRHGAAPVGASSIVMSAFGLAVA